MTQSDSGRDGSCSSRGGGGLVRAGVVTSSRPRGGLIRDGVVTCLVRQPKAKLYTMGRPVVTMW